MANDPMKKAPSKHDPHAHGQPELPAKNPGPPAHRKDGEGRGERPNPTVLALGKANYDGFVRAMGGTGPDGGAPEAWEDLHDKQRDGWQAGAEAVARKIQAEGPANLLPAPEPPAPRPPPKPHP